MSAIAHWQMDNDANDSVDARHGTLQGEAGFTTSAAIGSHALSLDGDDDYVDLTAHAADLPQGDAARSIAGWFRADDPLPRTYTFFGYGINANGRIFSITANQDQVSVDVRGHQWGMTGLGLTEGWHHIAVTFPAGGDSDDFLIYIDGQLQSSRTLSGTVRTVDTGAGVAYIGRNVRVERYYDGEIDDVRVFNYQLSAGRVLGLASDRELVARWALDDNANDSAGASDGTLQGGAGFTQYAAIGGHALSLDGTNDYVDLTSHAASFPPGRCRQKHRRLVQRRRGFAGARLLRLRRQPCRRALRGQRRPHQAVGERERP